MKLLPEVCLGPRTNPLHFGDDSVYDPDHMDLHETFTRSVSRVNELLSITFDGGFAISDCLSIVSIST